MDARIIRLGDPVGTSSAPRMATFEEAFGEYSDASGKGRKKRAAKRTDRRKAKVARKTEKFATRDEIKRAKTETRQSRRNDRKAGRVEARIDRRGARKAQRQDIRAEQQAARMARRMERSTQRQDRKDVKTQRELERDQAAQAMQEELDSMYPPQEGYADAAESDEGVGEYGSEGGGYSQDGGYADEGDYGSEEDNGGYYEDDSNDSGSYGGSYAEAAEGDEGVGEYGSEGGGYAEDGGYADEDSEYDYDEDYGSDYSDEDYGDFDGDDDVASVLTDSNAEAKTAQDIANRIEWNRKLISTVDKNPKVDANKANEMIVQSNNRIQELKCIASNFVSFDGDFANDCVGADGTVSGTPTADAIQRRINVMNRARIRARRAAGMPVTPIDARANAKVSPQRIVVPATSSADGGYGCTDATRVVLEGSSSATGTGIIGIDDVDDYGIEPLDIQLGFDASSSSKFPFGWAILGIAVGAGAIYALKKSKML